jgi:hypothetical protein
MEHAGCTLYTDYYDYYDEFLCSSSYSIETKIFRFKKNAIPISSQVDILKMAGFNVPETGHLHQFISPPNINETGQFVVFDEQQKPVVVTHSQALNLRDKERFAMTYIASHKKPQLRYLSVGTLYCWLVRTVGDDGPQFHPILHGAPNNISAQSIAIINQPIFSIDFIDPNFAINLCTSPILKDMHVESLWSAEKVAGALWSRVGHMPSVECGGKAS